MYPCLVVCLHWNVRIPPIRPCATMPDPLLQLVVNLRGVVLKKEVGARRDHVIVVKVPQKIYHE